MNSSSPVVYADSLELSGAEMEELFRTLGQIEGKIDGMKEEQRQQTEATKHLADKINSVESKVDKMLGWAAGVGAATGVAGSWLKSKLGGGA